MARVGSRRSSADADATRTFTVQPPSPSRMRVEVLATPRSLAPSVRLFVATQPVDGRKGPTQPDGPGP